MREFSDRRELSEKQDAIEIEPVSDIKLRTETLLLIFIFHFWKYFMLPFRL